MVCGLGDGVGVVRVRKFSSLIRDEMIRGDSSDDDELRLTKQQGFTLILAVLLGGLEGEEELLDFVISTLVEKFLR